jgi:hypothetical protein
VASPNPTDLTVTVTQDTPLVPGGPLRYTVKVTNQGPGIVSDFNLALTTPTSMRNVTYIPSDGTFDPVSRKIAPLSLDEGASVEVEVDGDLDPDATCEQKLDATTSLCPDDGTDPDGSNDSDDASDSLTPLPTATVSGDAEICLGETTVIQAVLTGTPPWTLTWSDGVTESVAASPEIRSVHPGEDWTYTVTAVSDAECPGTASGSATVSVTSISVTSPAALPAAEQCTTYPGASLDEVLKTDGGEPPYLYYPVAGPGLPSGLILSTLGSVSGTPTVSGTFSFGVEVRDANQCTTTGDVSVSLTVTAVERPTATVPTVEYLFCPLDPYDQAKIEVDLTGPNPPHPPWTLHWKDGGFDGPTETAGSSPWYRDVRPSVPTVYWVDTVSDACQPGPLPSGRATVTPKWITVSPSTLPDGVRGTPYSEALHASGGVGVYTYATTDPLPAGLSLSSVGVLSGTPTAGGHFGFTVTATDAFNCPGSTAVSLYIAPGGTDLIFADGFESGNSSRWSATVP